MHLKNLSLKGFKSFADTASIDLEPGVTVVVGPNGSGKSNVVDAIAWVLGAQAPTAVRSQKMDDVIFAGTKGYLDGIPTASVGKFEEQFLVYMRDAGKDLLEEIRAEMQLSSDAEAKLTSVLDDFAKNFTA